jgi:hypothetical protein
MSRKILWSSIETPEILSTSRYSPPWPEVDDDEDQGSSPKPPTYPPNHDENDDDDEGSSRSSSSSSDDDRTTATTRRAAQAAQPPPPKRRRTQPQRPKNHRPRLNLEAKIFVTRCCVRDAELYSKLSRKNFWARIAAELEKELDIKHTTLSRTMTELVKKRKVYLECVSTGEKEDNIEFNQSIDSWIEVVDQDAGVLRTKKPAAGKPDKDTDDSLSARRDLLRVWNDNERRISTSSSRRQEGPDAQLKNSHDDSETQPPATSPAQESISQSSGLLEAPTTRRIRWLASSTDITNEEKTAFEKDWGRLVDFMIDRGDALLALVATQSQSQSQSRAIEACLGRLEQGVQDLKGDISAIMALLRQQTSST